MDERLCLRQNVGNIDRTVRFVLGAALIVIPAMRGWPLWAVAGLAALGGSQVVEATIRF